MENWKALKINIVNATSSSLYHGRTSYNILAIHQFPNYAILELWHPSQRHQILGSMCEESTFKLPDCICSYKRYLPVPRLVLFIYFSYQIGNGSQCQWWYQWSIRPVESLVHIPYPPLRKALVICLHILYRTDVVEGSIKLEWWFPNVSLLELFLKKFDLTSFGCPPPSRYCTLLFVRELVNVFSFFFNPGLRLWSMFHMWPGSSSTSSSTSASMCWSSPFSPSAMRPLPRGGTSYSMCRCLPRYRSPCYINVCWWALWWRWP